MIDDEGEILVGDASRFVEILRGKGAVKRLGHFVKLLLRRKLGRYFSVTLTNLLNPAVVALGLKQSRKIQAGRVAQLQLLIANRAIEQRIGHLWLSLQCFIKYIERRFQLAARQQTNTEIILGGRVRRIG